MEDTGESPSRPPEEASQSGGNLLTAEPSEDESGVDRLSELPDDLLTQILLRLDDAPAAGRTSVLASRWRRLWLLLPELRFPRRSEPRLVAAALAAHEAALSYLSVGTLDADAESVAAWLPAVARRLTGHLSFTNDATVRDIDGGGEEERGSVELPCFTSATSVTLDLGFLDLAVPPPTGVFVRLTDICLARIRFRSPCALGDAVSSPRCPCLDKLTVSDARGLKILKIRSDSLQELRLERVRGLEQLAVAAPALEYLSMFGCFWSGSGRTPPCADISAPALKVLRWEDLFDPISVSLGTMKHLQGLCPMVLFVYGSLAVAMANQDCLGLLRCFKAIPILNLTLSYRPNIYDDDQYWMEDMTMLPDIMILQLRVFANEHAFGASLFHVLRLCSGIKELTLDLAPPSLEAACLPGCICNEQGHWKTEELLLDHLQEVEVIGLRGSQHEVTVLKQLFRWATVLKKITVTFSPLITMTMAKELCQMFRSFSRPKRCMRVYMYNAGSSREDGITFGS